MEPEQRGQGVGTERMQQVVAWARERDLELLIVWPSERSRTLYARAGFRAESEIMEQVFRSE